jgi:hexosaminidase
MVNSYLREPQYAVEREEKALFKEVLIHLDLKGAPPKFEFLLDIIRYVAKNYRGVVTGFLIEFEDTFPYEGNLKPLVGNFQYTKEQLK